MPSPAFTIRAVRHLRDELRRADVRMAEDDHVRVVGGQRERGVLQGLALVDAEPAALIDIVSADRRFAASSKLDEVRVEDS